MSNPQYLPFIGRQPRILHPVSTVGKEAHLASGLARLT
jgi:hypothetical protein